LSKIDAEQIFAFFDTCHSGGVLGELQVGTERLVERLMKKSGVTVFVPAQVRKYPLSGKIGGMALSRWRCLKG
jgi:hypothetical protein